MKRLAMLLILLLLIFTTQIAIVQEKCFSIFDTKWVYKWNKTVEDYFIFRSDSTFEQYSAEIENNYFGSYFVSNDTIFASTDSAKYMHKFNKSNLKLLVKSDTLRIVYAKHGHAKPTTVFDKNYYFLKAKDFPK